MPSSETNSTRALLTESDPEVPHAVERVVQTLKYLHEKSLDLSLAHTRQRPTVLLFSLTEVDLVSVETPTPLSNLTYPTRTYPG